MNPVLKKFLPYIVALISFIALDVLYFNDIATGKKQMQQHDTKMYMGSNNEAVQYNKSTKETIFFTEAMFSGMPMYLINIPYYGNMVKTVFDPLVNLFLMFPLSTFFSLMLGFYVLLLTFKINPYAAIAGAFAFALSSNNLIFLSAGHFTKVVAISHIPLVLAGINLVLRGNKWWGASITAIGMALQMGANHFQISYYMFFIISLWMVAEAVYFIMQKKYSDLLIRGAIIGITLALGAATSLSSVMVSKEYGDYSIRGKSELTVNKKTEDIKSDGLDVDYTFEYSYSGIEPLTMLIPNIYGGAEQAPFDKKSETYKLASNTQSPKELTQYLLGYWGNLRITAGAPYFGAIVIFLFVLGFFLVKGPLKWGMAAATVLSIALAYGSNFPSFNYWMFYHFPYYNKFRAVTTAFVIAQVCVPVLAFYALKEFFDQVNEKEKTLKKIYWATGITAGICFFFILIPSATVDFSGAKYQQLFGEKGIPNEYLEAMTNDCSAIVRADAFRSFFFIIVAAALLFSYIKGYFRKEILFGALALFVVLDMMMVSKRYLGDEQMEKKKKAGTEEFVKSPADEYILNDNKDKARVLNLSLSTFNDASTSYYHRSIGGYHGAKMKRYQELIENRISPEIQYLQQVLQNSKSADSLNPFMFMSTPVLNMLDAKYVIYNAKAQPIVNNNTLGHCWFVKEVRMVENADSEITALNNFNPAGTVIIDKRYSAQLNNVQISADSSAVIKQVDYHPNHIKYESNASSPQVAVFSEIYYEPDWEVYVDGAKADYFRCNYVLRGMVVPAGKHTIEFKVNPKTYNQWETVSKASSIAIFALLLGSIFMWYRQRKQAA